MGKGFLLKRTRGVLCYLPGGRDSRGERTWFQGVKTKNKKQKQQRDNKFCEKFALFKTK